MLIKSLVGLGGMKFGGEMTVIEHLEEFRIRLIRSVIVVLALTIGAFMSKDFIFTTLILGPSKVDFWTYKLMCSMGESLCVDKLNFVLQNRSMGGQFYVHMTTSFIIGIILSIPYVSWEIWQYIKPALGNNFKSMTYQIIFFVSGLLLLGLLFGYYILAPLSINFLANYSIDDSVLNQFDINSYIDTITTLVLGCGIIFQLPILVYLLSKTGFLSPALMKKYRKHSIIGILFIAAIITPPDVVSQIIVTLPLYLLFEISILISASVYRSKELL